MRILITGGFGYLGGRLAEMLSTANNCELTLATRRALDAPPWAPKANVLNIDWTSDHELMRACSGMDAVVHLAGMNAADCAKDPVAALEFNGLGTARLLRAAIEQHVARFLYLSTAHVYGVSLSGIVDENTCPEPLHAYATSHRAAEDVVRAAHAVNAISGIAVRLSNSVGAPKGWESDCWSLLANDVCRQAVRTRKICLRTSGNQRRDFIATSETCRAIGHLLTVPAIQLGNGVFNVGGGWAPTILEMAQLIATRVTAILGFKPEIQLGTSVDVVGTVGLEFCTRRITDTGFSINSEDSLHREIDRLIQFCVEYNAAPA